MSSWLKPRMLYPVGLAYGHPRITEHIFQQLDGQGTHPQWAASPPTQTWLDNTFDEDLEQIPSPRVSAAARYLTCPDLLQQIADSRSVYRRYSAMLSPHTRTDTLTSLLQDLNQPSPNSFHGQLWAAAHATLHGPDQLPQAIRQAPSPAHGRAIAVHSWRHHRPHHLDQLDDILAAVSTAVSRYALLADLVYCDLLERRTTDWMFGPDPHPTIDTKTVETVWTNKLNRYNDIPVNRRRYLRASDGQTVGQILGRDTDGRLTFNINQLEQLPLRAVFQGRSRATPLLQAGFAQMLRNTYGTTDTVSAWQTTEALFNTHDLARTGVLGDVAQIIHTALAA